MKEIGKAVKINNLEFYQARHTFATLSRNLMKFSKSDVDEALNHVGSYGIADVYISKDFTIINENNFKLIDTVFEQFQTDRYRIWTKERSPYRQENEVYSCPKPSCTSLTNNLQSPCKVLKRGDWVLKSGI